MTIDIEGRIRRYAGIIDDAIDTDRATRPHQTVATSGRARNLTGPLLAAAAATVTVVGLGVIATTRDTTPAASEPIETPTTLSAAAAPVDPTGQGVVIDLTAVTDNDTYEPAWDSIGVAPDAVGWFDATSGLPDDLATQRSLTTDMSPAVLSAFFTCAEWTVDGDGPLCNKLAGGNGIEHIDYGETGGPYVGIGVQIGDTDVRSQLWNQAYGALWGYETINTVPEPTEISFGDVTGLSYRVDDQAYLAWEYEAGTVVWLHSQGLNDEQLADIAASVKPVGLPDRLPLLMEVAPVGFEPVSPMPGDRVKDLSLLVSSNGPPALKYGTVGGRPCVAFDFFEQCRSIEAAAMIPAIEWGDSIPDRFVAIAPAGSGLTLRTTGVDGTTTDNALTPTGLGFDLATWTATSLDEHLESATLVDGAGNVVAGSGPLGEIER